MNAPTPSSQPQTPAPDQEVVIEVDDLLMQFGSQTVLSGLDLKVRRGETLVIMGGSGCGKSTLLRLMIGAITPTRGKIRLFGEDIAVASEANLDALRKRFGILFQSAALYQSMSIAENVALPMRELTDLPGDLIDLQVKMKLEAVGLREHADKFPAQISGGMKKRAGLARALALDPEIIFYDEPSAGLDPVTSAEIDQLILTLTKKLGVTSVVVTHEMDSAFTIADRMVMLDKGRCLKIAPRADYERIRSVSKDEAAVMPEDDRIVRQFVRGDAFGPITDRRTLTSYSDDLMGLLGHMPASPSITPSR
ncbi:MAG: ABC transporter ATP-binding protein [Planctomycetaceae bacterium]|nr:MAG: ABC transporter ATP-binding protein [Planctomycetaceae bacterium]RLT01004.1 MAG: ABC transporter ATP-binding protein [Planctomycetota bacterium]